MRKSSYIDGHEIEETLCLQVPASDIQASKLPEVKF